MDTSNSEENGSQVRRAQPSEFAADQFKLIDTMNIHVGGKYLLASSCVAQNAQGQKNIVVVAKHSWTIPGEGQRPRPIPSSPLLFSDEFYSGSDGAVLRLSSDFAHKKARCDVVFDACAYNDGNSTDTTVLARVSTLTKSIKVYGPRYWQKRRSGYTLTAPEALEKVPLHYGFAFGGTVTASDTHTAYCEANPAGRGWLDRGVESNIDGDLAPCLEFGDEAVVDPYKNYKPAALSAIPANWRMRQKYAGTYNEDWRQQQFPLIPSDFNERYFQCAPIDQQIDYPVGGERVQLVNMFPTRNQVQFVLPSLIGVPMKILRTNFDVIDLEPVVDTLIFETEKNQFTAVWRGSAPIQRRIQEIDSIVVGMVDPAWWSAKQSGVEFECC